MYMEMIDAIKKFTSGHTVEDTVMVLCNIMLDLIEMTDEIVCSYGEKRETMKNEKQPELIERKTVLEVLCNYCGVEGCCPEGGCAEYQHISGLLPVNAAEVVRGRMVPCTLDVEFPNYLIWECSKRRGRVESWHCYCPSCGAKLDA